MWSNRVRRAWLGALLMASVAVAGCAESSGDPVESIDFEALDETALEAGKGAIAGLLIDDRFRPIQLVEAGDAVSEFQAEGFVLLQETGQEVRTTENGEFVFLDLDPGSYTIRITASGHEAVPQQIRVEEGSFAEASVVARRVVSNAGAILTQEFAVFIPCNIGWGVQMVVFGCGTDGSGENYRPGFVTDYTVFPDATFLVTEMQARDHHVYSIQVRESNDSPGGGNRYVVAKIEGDYVKMTIEKGVKNEVHDAQKRNVPWENDVLLNTIMFPAPPFTIEMNDALEPFCNEAADEAMFDIWQTYGIYNATLGYAPNPRTCDRSWWGVGVGLAYEARFLQSLFIGPPEVDIETYCAICGDES